MNSTRLDPPSERLSRAIRELDALLINWEKRDRVKMIVNLQPVSDLLARVGDPQDTFRSIHVTGTKGKGSVSALVEAALVEAGWRVGRYGSPHLNRINERISIDGRDIDDDSFARAIERVVSARSAAGREGTPGADATWFDVITASAFSALAAANVAWGVIEVGVGGRLDSTNVIRSDVCVITNVELEHTEILGDTVAAIAWEKAGIIKKGSYLVTPIRPASVEGGVVRRIADGVGVPVIQVNTAANSCIAETNKAIARAVLAALGTRGVVKRTNGRALSNADLPDTLASRVALPGRMERVLSRDLKTGVEVTVVLDGAHVPFAVEKVCADLSALPDLGRRPPIVLLGLSSDKDANGIVDSLSKFAAHIVCTPIATARKSWRAEDLCALSSVSSEVVPSVSAGIERCLTLAASSWILVIGSLYLVGEVRQILNLRGTRVS